MKEETTEETEENAEETIDLEETMEDTTTKESSILISSDRYVACVAKLYQYTVSRKHLLYQFYNRNVNLLQAYLLIQKKHLI